MDARIQSVLSPVVRCFMVVCNKMAACLSPWPAAEPAIVDTTTLEGWEMAKAKQLYLPVFSQKESYSSWLIQPLNFNLSFWPRIPSPQSDTLVPVMRASWGLGMTWCVSNDLAPPLCGERCSVEWASLPTDRSFGWSRGEANSPYLKYLEGRTWTLSLPLYHYVNTGLCHRLTGCIS